MYNFFMFFCYKEKNNLSLSIFCQKLPFLPQNAWFFFLKSKNGVLEIFLKSNILCTKILGTVKFFLKSKNFLKSNVLKSKIHCTWNIRCLVDDSFVPSAQPTTEREFILDWRISGLCLLSAPSLILQRKKSKKLQACERQAREKIASFFYQETKSNCATLL